MGRGLSRGSLPVRNTGEMGAGAGSSTRAVCGVPGVPKRSKKNRCFPQTESLARVEAAVDIVPVRMLLSDCAD